MPRARGVYGLQELGHPAQSSLQPGHYARNEFPLPLFHHRASAQGQEPHHGAHLEPLGAAVGEPQQVIIEAVLFVPHAVLVGPVHPRGDKEEMLHELVYHILVGRVVGGEFYGEFEHVLREERHPRRAIRLLQMPACRERRAAVEDADVVEAEEAALEDVLAEPVLAVHPPGEVQHQFVECGLEEVQVHVAA
jgi:hypothetical protein